MRRRVFLILLLLVLCLLLLSGRGRPRAPPPSLSEYAECAGRRRRWLGQRGLSCELPDAAWTRGVEPDWDPSCSCALLRERLCLPSASSSAEEAAFPLAFVIIVDADVSQAARLLALLFQPQNVFCLAYDRHHEAQTRARLARLAACFPNVVLGDGAEWVEWGLFSVLASAVHCLRALAAQPAPWRYAQILAWSDLPLRTNLEMVRIFKILNGSQDVELKRQDQRRFRHEILFVHKSDHNETSNSSKSLSKTDTGTVFKGSRKEPPPYNVTLYKGSFGASLSHDFVTYVLEDKRAQSIYHWLNRTFIPDESLWSTLVHNPTLGAPGAFPGHCLASWAPGTGKPHLSRFQSWDRRSCPGGRRTHASCVFGVAEMEIVRRSPRLVAHKFYPNYQPAAWECLALRFGERTADPGRAMEDFSGEFYRQLPSVALRTDPSLNCSQLWRSKFF